MTPCFAHRALLSHLRLDADGRVLRMDSFLNTIAPGARMGWVTASEQVIERIVREWVAIYSYEGVNSIVVAEHPGYRASLWNNINKWISLNHRAIFQTQSTDR